MEHKICLNGYWDFSGQSRSVTEMPSLWDKEKILVPSPYNINTFAAPYRKEIAGEPFWVKGGDFKLYPTYPDAWGNLSCGFYRRIMQVSEAFLGKRIFLRFDGLSYHSVVYVNGQKAAEEWEGFLPVEIEITGLVRFGEENEILVGAEKAKSLIYRDEDGRNRLDYPIGSFWGEHIGGIWQDVWMIVRPALYISVLSLTTDTKKRELAIGYELDGKMDVQGSGENLILELELWQEKEGSRRLAAVRALQKGKFWWHYREGEVKEWEPDSPVLYTVVARLKKGEVLLAEERKRTGFRSFTCKGSLFFLNDRPIRLVADAWHYMGYSVQSPEYARSWYRMEKEAGVNMVRLHAQPWPEFFYDIADEMGMLLTAESAVWASHCNFSYNDTFFQNSKKHIRRLVQRDISHPSVVVWSPENECIPAYHVCGSHVTKTVEELENRIWEMAQEVRLLDDSRLISCDGSGDLGGRLPVYSIHYPGYDCPVQTNKPIAIGEMGSMYYSTPDTLCFYHGETPLYNMEERLRAVAEDAFHNLMGQRRWAAQICVFNLIWYGLWPIPFTEQLLPQKDTAAPGIKPGRRTPYLRTLNAGAEPGLQEYYPNPVFTMAQKAYAPVRLYPEDIPTDMWRGEQLQRKLYIFHDKREKGKYRLRIITKTGEQTCLVLEEMLTLSPCSVTEKVFPLMFTGEADYGEVIFTLCEASGAWQESEKERCVVQIYRPEEYSERGKTFWKTVRLLDAPQEERKLPALFAPGEKFQFREPVSYSIVPQEEYRTGRILYFDGEGNAVMVWNGAEIISGVDLLKTKGPMGALLAVRLQREVDRLLLEVGRTEGGIRPREGTRRLVVCEEKGGRTGTMLRAMGYSVTNVTEEELMTVDGKRSLLLLGRGKGKILTQEMASHFERILITDLETGEWESLGLKKTSGKCFHLAATSDVKKWLNVYGLHLYGLENGKERNFCDSVLTDGSSGRERLLTVPDIDWRMWNNNAEALKTVACYRSEVEKKDGFVLAREKMEEREIYYCILGMDPQNAKQRFLWARLLWALGVKPEGMEKKAETTEMTTDTFSVGIAGAEQEYLTAPI